MKDATVFYRSWYADKTGRKSLVSEGRRSSKRPRRKSEGTIEAGFKRAGREDLN
jgi:hypothetical protein